MQFAQWRLIVSFLSHTASTMIYDFSSKVSAVRAIETARAKNSGQLKANMYDPLHRLASALKIFFEDNERQPQHLKQPVTTKLIVAKVRDTACT